jgi:DNA polymerase-3 subunit chi
MAQVTFYVLEQTDSLDHWVCQLATNCYRNKKRCLILCNRQDQAEQLDELLWQQPVDAFVPHNLTGEGPKGGAPVELSWQVKNAAGRHSLINLSLQVPAFAQHFAEIHDFVPTQEAEKQQARQRYKSYRAAGHMLETKPITTLTN